MASDTRFGRGIRSNVRSVSSARSLSHSSKAARNRTSRKDKFGSVKLRPFTNSAKKRLGGVSVAVCHCEFEVKQDPPHRARFRPLVTRRLLSECR